MLFTETSLSAIEPRNYAYYLVEAGSKGFAVKIQPTGTKSFYFRKKTGGKRIDQFLGYDLGTARRKYIMLRQLEDTNETPRLTLTSNSYSSLHEPPATANGHRQYAPEGQPLYIPGYSFETLSVSFLEHHVAPNLRPATCRNYVRYIEKVSDSLRGTPFMSPTVSTQQARAALKSYLDHLRTITPVQANRIKETMSSCFKWGVIEDVCYSSPVYGIKSAKEKPRQRTLSDTELAQFLQALSSSHFKRRTVYCLLLILSTGLRASEALSLTGSNIDHERKQLVITETKNGKQFLVPLSDFTLAILRESTNGLGPSKRLFNTSVYGLRQVCVRTTEKASISPCSTHDLRRTFATLAGSLGINLTTISCSSSDLI